jgi:uncharacterized protein (TIRG00374 family)
MNKRLVHLTVGLITSAAMVFLLLRIVDTRAIVSAVEFANPRLVVMSIGVYFLAMCVRSVVWHRLLPAADSTITLLRVTIVGFAVNYLMPVRIGEFARAYLVVRWCGIDYPTTFASLVAERTLDGLAVGLILLVGLLFIPVPAYVLVLGLMVGVLFTSLAIALIIASWRKDGTVALVSRLARLLPSRIGARLVRLTARFTSGLDPLRDWRALPGLALLAIVGWLLQFGVFYLLMLAFPFAASFPLALVSGGVANFATLLPSAPGFVGTFDAALIGLLMDVQHAPPEFAAAYALVLHAVLVVPIVVVATVILWRSNLSFAHVLGRTLPFKPNLGRAEAS